jgi:hypothetical protein
VRRALRRDPLLTFLSGTVSGMVLAVCVAVAALAVGSRARPPATTRYVEGVASSTAPDTNDVMHTVKSLRSAPAWFCFYRTVLLNHDESRPVGVVEHARVAGNKLRVVLRIEDDEAWRMVVDGRLRGLSCGVLAVDPTPVFFDGREIKRVETAVWTDVSLATMPANPDAWIERFWEAAYNKCDKCPDGGRR